MESFILSTLHTSVGSLSILGTLTDGEFGYLDPSWAFIASSKPDVESEFNDDEQLFLINDIMAYHLKDTAIKGQHEAVFNTPNRFSRCRVTYPTQACITS